GPDAARPRLTLAWVLAARGLFEPALTELAEVLRVDDRHARAYALRALIHQQRKDYLQASEDASAALQIDPYLGSAYLTRARAALALGWLELAKGDLEQYLRVTPDPPDAAQVRRAIQQIEAELARPGAAPR